MEENFFHNYPTSLKRTVDFVGDRVASRFIKNYRSSVFVQIIDLYRQKYVNPIAVSKTDDGVESPVKVCLILLTVACNNCAHLCSDIGVK